MSSCAFTFTLPRTEAEQFVAEANKHNANKCEFARALVRFALNNGGTDKVTSAEQRLRNMERRIAELEARVGQ